MKSKAKTIIDLHNTPAWYAHEILERVVYDDTLDEALRGKQLSRCDQLRILHHAVWVCESTKTAREAQQLAIEIIASDLFDAKKGLPSVEEIDKYYNELLDNSDPYKYYNINTEVHNEQK